MRVKRGLGRTLAVVSILLVVTAAATAYSYYLLQQSSSSQSQLQQLVSNLESRNTQLQQELNSGVTPNNASVLGLDPVSIYRSANRSIVTIQGDQVTTVNTFFGPQQSLQVVLGSGFVIQDTGSYYIVTNFHVLSGDTNLTVTFWNGNSYVGKVVGTDPYSDLGVVSVTAPPSQLFPIQIASSSSLQVGQPIVAIGNPFGLTGSMTFGIISQVGRTIQDPVAGNFSIASAIQFSAPINPGNSGGALLNSKGEVVGITTAVVNGAQGVGFAIPSDTIIRELPSLITTGKYNLHPYLGIGSADMSYALAQKQGTNVTYGALIEQVVPGGPASRAGLRAGNTMVTLEGTQYVIGGDIIVSLNRTKIVNTDALSTYLEGHALAGQTIQVGIIRGGSFQTVSVVLGTRPPPPSS
ncbi:MAG: PDZ domain-containing protein [Thaumarchaeota archaeon]|nr:MAG: PDZ domain-containing protein [Nitrososphaerota archaeon]